MQRTLFLGIALVGASLYLAFFTTHFGGFHFIQSKFLLAYIRSASGSRDEPRDARRSGATLLARPPSAFLARRYAFTRRMFGRARLATRADASAVGRARRRWDQMAESRVTGRISR